MLSPRIAPPVVILALASILALTLALALAAVSPAHAQESDVRIQELDCDSDPEVVKIENAGAADQDLDGWQLQSDPPGSEAYALSTVGDKLVAGVTVTIESGPAATALFIWDTQEIYRDGDSTDFVRIVDDTGGVVDQVNCGGAAATPTATPAPVATPGGVPNGGGPPPPSAAGLTTLLLLAIGGSIAVLGAGIVAIPRLRPSSVEAAAAPPQARPARRAPRGVDLALVGFAAAIATLLMLRRRRH